MEVQITLTRLGVFQPARHRVFDVVNADREQTCALL